MLQELVSWFVQATAFVAVLSLVVTVLVMAVPTMWADIGRRWRAALLLVGAAAVTVLGAVLLAAPEAVGLAPAQGTARGLPLLVAGALLTAGSCLHAARNWRR